MAYGPFRWLLKLLVLECIVEPVAITAQRQFEWCPGHFGMTDGLC